MNWNVVRLNLDLRLMFRLIFAGFTKYNAALVIQNRKKRKLISTSSIINHVALYEKTP